VYNALVSAWLVILVAFPAKVTAPETATCLPVSPAAAGN